tara:strand:- start:40 stop:483 length:444 start_codon:yes stop_codon:yes gene_type:complete
MLKIKHMIFLVFIFVAMGCTNEPKEEISEEYQYSSITIVKPKDGEIISGTEVKVKVEVSNFTLDYINGPKILSEGYIHYTLDSRFSFDTDKKQNTFVRVSAGQHFLGVELVHNDGSSLSPRRIDFVNFITESNLSVIEDQWPSLLGE